MPYRSSTWAWWTVTQARAPLGSGSGGNEVEMEQVEDPVLASKADPARLLRLAHNLVHRVHLLPPSLQSLRAFSAFSARRLCLLRLRNAT